MTKHSEKTASEIVTEAESLPETEEPDEEEIVDTAEVAVPEVVNPLRFVDPATIEYYPDITKAREEANIPPHKRVKDILDRQFLIYSKKPQKAALPDTGELRDGFFCTCIDVETKEAFTTWIGQTALVRDLSLLTPPFRVTIVKHGRTYRFE